MTSNNLPEHMSLLLCEANLVLTRPTIEDTEEDPILFEADETENISPDSSEVREGPAAASL